MSKLDELIKELCPNGVEYKGLGEVCDFQNGFAFKSSLFKENGEVILRITNIYNGVVNEKDLKYFSLDDYKENLENYIISNNDIVIAMSGATTGKVGINNTDKKFYLNQRVGKFVPHITKLNNKYLYHFLLSKSSEMLKNSSGSGAQPNLSTENIKKLIIPVPPLEVQEEIVKILDSYTKSVEELKEKLNEELIARKKQHSWYRDYLLKFENKIKMVKIGDLFEFKNGINKDKSSFGKGTPIINYVNVYKKNKIYFEDLKGLVEASNDELVRYGVKRGDVFFTRTSETIEEIGYTSVLLEDIENCVFSGFLLRARPITDLLLPEYCAYCFLTSNIRNAIIKKSTYTTRALTNGTSLSQIEIPLPPLEVQKRIVEVLDNFEKICNDLNIGLPAEIEARQKQYEFYRNFLLTFKIENCTLPKTRQDKTRHN